MSENWVQNETNRWERNKTLKLVAKRREFEKGKKVTAVKTDGIRLVKLIYE